MEKQYHEWQETRAKKFSPEQLARIDQEVEQELLNDEINQREAALAPLLTDEFLALLIKVVQVCNWSIDMQETVALVNWCHDVAGKPRPSIGLWKVETP